VLCITLVIVTAFSLTTVTHAENLNKNRVVFKNFSRFRMFVGLRELQKGGAIRSIGWGQNAF